MYVFMYMSCGPLRKSSTAQVKRVYLQVRLLLGRLSLARSVDRRLRGVAPNCNEAILGAGVAIPDEGAAEAKVGRRYQMMLTPLPQGVLNSSSGSRR